MFRSYILQTWIILNYFMFVCIDGSGYVEIRLKSYRNKNGTDQAGKCCDNKGSSGCDPCDPYLQAFLNQGSSRTNLSETVTTGIVNNSNVITFGNSTGKISNPFKLTFRNFSNSLVLTLIAWDDDKFDTIVKSNDKLEELQFNVGQGEPSPFYTSPNFVLKAVKGRAVELEFEYRILCDKYYYGNCNKFCKPKAGQFNCSRAGSKVCEPGWSGTECDSGPCQSHKCEHNSTCVPKPSGNYSCSCAPYYSGMFCGVKLTVPSPTTSSYLSALITTTLSHVSVHQDQSSNPSDKTGLIVGCAAAAAILIAALLGLVICLILKKKQGRKTNVLPKKFPENAKHNTLSGSK